MAISKKQLKDLIKEQMPGYKIVEEKPTDASAPQVEPDSTSPSLEELRRKYLGESAAIESGNESTGNAPPARNRATASRRGNDDDEMTIVLVEPQSADARVHGAGPKAIVVSKEGKIVGTQG